MAWRASPPSPAPELDGLAEATRLAWADFALFTAEGIDEAIGQLQAGELRVAEVPGVLNKAAIAARIKATRTIYEQVPTDPNVSADELAAVLEQVSAGLKAAGRK